jgi:hypothetical protein|tara:strand:- start:789 stop:890 length:102 start_codon:yes stop_codon:yes gene_type:complete
MRGKGSKKKAMGMKKKPMGKKKAVKKNGMRKMR